MTGPAKPSALPTVALVLSLVGVCFPPLMLVGLVLGIVGLVNVGKDPAYGGKTQSIIAIVLAPLALLSLGILAAVAIPNFVRFQARSKQVECTANLKAAFTAQTSFFAENETYGDPAAVGFSPERSRYVYVFEDPARGTGEGVLPARHPEAPATETLLAGIPANLREQLGVHGQCPDCSLTIACAGNVDGDAALDVWTVSTRDRTGPSGAPVRAGVPRHDVDDLER